LAVSLAGILPENKIMTPQSSKTSESAAKRSHVIRLRAALFLLLLIFLVAAGAYALYELNKPAEKFSVRLSANRAMPVQAAVIEQKPFDRYIDALGTVTAAQTVVVYSRVDGELQGVYFQEGQRVKEGDLLAEIDARPYAAQLAQAEGQLARDMAQLENAKNDLKRYRTLIKSDSVSQQQVANQQALVAQYDGTVKYDQAQVDLARLNVSYTKITAPIAGRIGLRRVDKGNMVRASDVSGLAVITQDQPIDVVFTITESDVRAVAKAVNAGEQFHVEAWDRAKLTKLADGVMTTMDNQIDVATGTLKVKARFDNQDALLFPNQFVNVRMKIATIPAAILAPSSAVQRGSMGTFAYVIVTKDEKTSVTVRPVTIGDETAGLRVITSGLNAGEQVVIDGTDRLREGSVVEVVN
jgi:multidrug efflux system membrane fusion protein